MKKSPDAGDPVDAAPAEAKAGVGVSTIDEKGRIALPKSVRTALGVHAGSSLAYIVLDDAVLFIPQDAHLAQLQQQAVQALTEAGLTVQDLLDQLPQAREAVMREAYSPELLARLRKLRVEQGASHETSVEDGDHTRQAE
ncbi:MAG TPA: AbrB/MazE/SpoVT family DNA-binding domain-containing protein [Ktedonobacterales bacterium]|jgi:AbrB family looped-hinge helix DNA binding protein|nr:AbrB/MazE/SpoVT family DNA-binding domain-containing protein [Ktedonobacterales bacterium]